MESLKGKLLLASPTMADPNFARTVVLMVEHNEEGALGLVLNRPLEATIKEAWEDATGRPCTQEGVLHEGGPCPGPLMVVHTYEEASQVEVGKGIHFATEEDKVSWLMEHNGDRILFFVGYAGWGPGQLDAEMAAGAWLTSEAASDQIFAVDQDLWKQLMRHLPPALRLLALNPKIVPIDPSNN